MKNEGGNGTGRKAAEAKVRTIMAALEATRAEDRPLILALRFDLARARANAESIREEADMGRRLRASAEYGKGGR